jgi:hypothetical protein
LETLLPTIAIAFIIFLVAVAFLAIGLIFTGKSKIEKGSCSRVPNRKGGDCASSSCSFCCQGGQEDNQEKSFCNKEEQNKEPPK